MESILVEQLGDGDLLIDALDGLGEHGGHGDILDLVAALAHGLGNGVQQGDLLDDAVVQALQRGAGPDR